MRNKKTIAHFSKTIAHVTKKGEKPMSQYHCDKHRQIKIKRGDIWVCSACEPENKMDVPDFMKGLFSGRVDK